MLLLQQMIVLFIYMLIGYFACKKGVLDEFAGAKISWLVVNIANPALILSAAVNNGGVIEGSGLFLTAGISVAMFAVLILLAQIVPYIFRLQKEKWGNYRVMTIFNNIGFMGFPVIASVYGQGALLYAAIFMIPFNILLYTYGIQMLSKSREGQFQWRKILNIGVISCIIAAVLYLWEIPTPSFFRKATEGLSHLTAPLSMIVIGISLTRIKFRELFTDVRLVLFSVVKLLLVPIIGMMGIKLFVTNEILRGVCMIMLATPVASMTAMLAQQYGSDYEMVSKGVALTTILSVATIPIVSMVVL